MGRVWGEERALFFGGEDERFGTVECRVAHGHLQAGANHLHIVLRFPCFVRKSTAHLRATLLCLLWIKVLIVPCVKTLCAQNIAATAHSVTRLIVLRALATSKRRNARPSAIYLQRNLRHLANKRTRFPCQHRDFASPLSFATMRQRFTTRASVACAALAPATLFPTASRLGVRAAALASSDACARAAYASVFEVGSAAVQ